MTAYKQLKADLTIPWVIAGMMLTMLLSYNVICHVLGNEIQIVIAEEQRILIRSVFYLFAIILFPVVNLLRHIMVRLNQTMPGTNPAKNRYLITIIITLCAIEIVGVLGLIMYILGDGYNTLYIFTVLAVLGVFLQRPKIEEYQSIIDALEK